MLSPYESEFDARDLQWRHAMRVGYVRLVDSANFYAVVEGQLVPMASHTTIPTELRAPLTTEIEAIIGEKVLPIGGWQETSDGPLILAITGAGELVSVIATEPSRKEALSETLLTIDEWLASMRLRELSELSGDKAEFYEGLLDLSPDASIALAPTRRYVLLSASESVDLHWWSELLPDASFDVCYLDVLRAAGGPAIVKLRAPHNNLKNAVAPPMIPPTDLSRLPPPPVVTDITPLPAEHVTADDSVIDLTALEHRLPEIMLPPSYGESALALVAGQTYPIDVLPQLFAPYGEGLEAISDSLFAVDGSISLVATVPERRRDTPFEDRDRFRWIASLEERQLLQRFSTGPLGELRTIHLFVESERQAGYALYVGTLTGLESGLDPSESTEPAMFTISPALEESVYRMLRKGKLPRRQERLDQHVQQR